MDRKKKAIFISGLFLLSMFLILTITPQTPFAPGLAAQSSTHQLVGAKADPSSEDYPYWWNTSYLYRVEIIFNNSASPYAVVNRPVDIYLSFANETCYNGSVRVQLWNSTSKSWNPGTQNGIIYQIWNETFYSPSSFYSGFTITFYINVSAFSTASYFVYYNSSGSPPTFTPEISVSGTSGNWTFEGKYYRASVNTSINGGKIYISFNNVTGSWNQWSYNNEFHWSPEYDIDGKKRWLIFESDQSWSWKSSGHAASSYVDPAQEGPLFVMFKAGTDLVGSGSYGAPTNIGYVNVTYRFFRWGWITQINTTITYDFNYGVWWPDGGWWDCRYDTGTYIGNSWRFDPQLGSLRYKDGTGTHSIEPFTGPHDIGTPYWFAIYDSSTGRAAGIVDLMFPSISDPSEPNSWSYVLHGTGSTPEYWERRWVNLHLDANDYIVEKYAFYVWDASGGDFSEFTSFAEGVSAIQRQAAPLVINVTGQEHVHFTVNFNVTDYDGNVLAGANITVYNGSVYVASKITNSSGKAVFYLEPGTYSFDATWNATWNGATYATYHNSTQSTIVSHTSIKLVFYNITTLWCRTQYGAPDYNPIQNAYVNLSANHSGNVIASLHVNLTGWVEFHINRSSTFDNYDVRAFYDDGTPLEADPYLNVSIDSNTTLNFTVTLAPEKKYTYIIITNGTSLSSTWGDNVVLKVYWRDEDGNNLNVSDSTINGTLNWTLNFVNGTNVYGPTSLSPQGSGTDIYYVATIPWTLLYGGETYQIYFNAESQSTTYLSSANQTLVDVEPATFSVQLASLGGPYYWKHSDIPLWAYVTNNDTGQPVTTAIVTFTTTGGEISGQLNYASQGNYTYTIPASVVETDLSAATYGLRFTVSSTNYTSMETLTQLVISPAQTEFIISSIVEGYYGDMLSISVIYRDAVDGTLINNGTVSYLVEHENVYGSLEPSAGGNWTGTFNSTLLRPGIYVFRLSASSPNYEHHIDWIPLNIKKLPIEIKAVNVLTSPVNKNPLLSVQLNDTHNNELVLNASVWYVVKDTDGHTVIFAHNLTDTSNNGTYSALLNLTPETTPPSNYIIEVTATKDNYTVAEKAIQLVVQGIPTVLSFQTVYFSSLNNPAAFLFGNFGQVENDAPFVVFTFRYQGSVIPNASVSAGGWPVIALGGGVYAVVIPTYGLPPSAYPIVVSASAPLYESQQSFFLLQVKERSVLIPLVNIRVPLTLFLMVVLSLAIPTSVFTTYTYIKRARIPAIIRRINEMIKAISRGEPVTVRPITRESVISRILEDELSIVGVEPNVEAYVPVELAQRIIPLLVEAGMGEREAYALAVELKTATPAEREKLLESVGVPGETSERIMKLIEEEEERKEAFRKPSKPERAAEKPESQEEKEQERKPPDKERI